MKRKALFSLLSLLCITIFSCKSGFEPTKPGFEKISAELISKFDADAYYTDIELVNDKTSDESILVTETKYPATMKQEQWLRYSGGEWEKQADVSFTADGADPKSFMFQLNKEVSLSKFSDLIDASKAQLAKEKNVKNAVLTGASVKSNNKMNSKETGIFYYVTLRDANSKKDYRFVYDLNGALRSMTE